MNANTVRQSIRDSYHRYAIQCGLKWVDGHGAYSIFEGNHAEWSKLADLLATLPRDSSVTAVRRRVSWAVDCTASHV
jgi:hypothetical protein